MKTFATTSSTPNGLETINFCQVIALTHYELTDLRRLTSLLQRAQLNLRKGNGEGTAKAAGREALDLLARVAPYRRLAPRLERAVTDGLEGVPSPYGLQGCLARLAVLLRTLGSLSWSMPTAETSAPRLAFFRSALMLAGRR